MFEELGFAIREEVVLTLFHAQLETEDAGELEAAQAAQTTNGNFSYEHQSLAGADAIAASAAAEGLGGSVATAALPGGGSVATQRTVDEHDKIGRNDPCWCGSGKKFKKCHGA